MSNWPDGMNDAEAVERLQATLISACEGNRDLSTDRAYKEVRKPLIKRADLEDVVPRFVRMHRDLNSFWAYIRKVSDQWAPRREHVWAEFAPLLDRTEGKTKAPIRSSRWTGRRTASEQAKVVLNVGPDALYAAELLLNELERPLHNGGPVDDDVGEAIERLKELHAALGELIRLADEDASLDTALGQIHAIKRKSLRWSAETMDFMVGPLPLTTASTVIGVGLFGLVNVLTKGSVALDPNIVGAAAMGVHAAGAASRRKGNEHSE